MSVFSFNKKTPSFKNQYEAMMKDFFISFKDNFNEKTRNPFLGTYLLVWMVRNWELIYAVFNFDDEYKLQDKIDFIKSYYLQHNFIFNLGINILWALGILVVTYLLLNLSRLIVNLSEKRLTPWIYKITDSQSIVLKSEYERMRAERDDIQRRLDNERDSKSRLESRIKGLEEDLVRVSENNIEESTVTEEQSKSDDEAKLETDYISKIIEKLKEKDLLDEFVNASKRIKKGRLLNDEYEYLHTFLLLRLIQHARAYLGENLYSLSPDGEAVLKSVVHELK